MTNLKAPDLDRLFKPRNIIIYEAKDKLYYFLNGLKEHGFDLNKLYLINHSESEVLGLKCYKNVDDIPDDEIDLLILAVRREILVKALREVISKKKINFIHFFSAGTGEADDVGEQIEKELYNMLKNELKETRAIGPNCMGVYCPAGKNTYSPTFPTEPGKIGLIFHSGDLHSKTITYGLMRYNLKYAKGVSVGNCVDLQVSDFLLYFNEDDDIDIICVYFEGFSKFYNHEGRKLFNILKNMNKPVLFLKGGRTKRAQTAVSSHTGSLGTPQRIWNAIFKQTPTINAGKNLDDLLDTAFLFDHFFKKYKRQKRIQNKELIKYFPKTKNAILVVWSGGLGIIDTDELIELGINLPQFKGAKLEKLRNVYPLKIGSLSNPLDLPWIVATDIFVNLCKAAIDDDIDLFIIETDSPLYWDEERFNRYYNNLLKIKEHIESLNKILILVLPEYPHKVRQNYYKKLLNDCFIVYPSINRAAMAFLRLYEYGSKLNKFKNI
ncbi:MAG: CoA-binding protein [Promethearchaeia archaeon]